MPLVAPGVCRFAPHGLIHGRPWVQIWDIDINSGGIGGRDDNVQDQAKVILNNYIDHVKPKMATGWSLLGCRWVDLDTASSTTGEATAADSPRVMPSPGTLGQPLSSQVAILVKKQGPSARGRRTGRSYFCGASEAATDGASLNPTDLTAWNTMLASFKTGVNQNGATSFGGYDSAIVVVHTLGGVFADFDVVTSLQAQSRLATQRRRQRA